jgi:hypothetical protein
MATPNKPPSPTELRVLRELVAALERVAAMIRKASSFLQNS